jgi:hypothetical protein
MPLMDGFLDELIGNKYFTSLIMTSQTRGGGYFLAPSRRPERDNQPY